MKMKALFILLFGVAVLHPAQAQKKNSDDGLFAQMETNKGTIVLQLEFEKTPVTVANFVSLAEGKNTFIIDEKLRGKPFYDGLKFHRVINDFMIQGGDPLGNGSGGPGYRFKDEITDLKHSGPGILSMANSGPATNGSQFFITHKETPWLDGKHTVFGHVVSGMDVVNKIEMNDVITKVTINRKGSAAKKFDAGKVFAAYYANKAEDDKKQAAMEAEKRAQQVLADAENRKKAEVAKADKAVALSALKATSVTTDSGLQYKIIKSGNGQKPVPGSTYYVYYAGFLEDGTLFDSNVESVSKDFGKFDAARAAQNGYLPFPFTAGKKDGLIQGFIESLDLINFGDKIVAFIPAKLGYGAQGAGGVIPPNANIIFEIEIVESLPNSK